MALDGLRKAEERLRNHLVKRGPQEELERITLQFAQAYSKSHSYAPISSDPAPLSAALTRFDSSTFSPSIPLDPLILNALLKCIDHMAKRTRDISHVPDPSSGDRTLSPEAIGTFGKVAVILRALAIQSKCPQNVATLSSEDVVENISVLGWNAVCWVRRIEYKNVEALIETFAQAVTFLESVYDPEQKWKRKHLRTTSGIKSKSFALVSVISISLFADGFRDMSSVENSSLFTELSMDSKLMLIHLFGAMIYGSQINSVRAINPSSANVLLRLLLPSNDQIMSNLILRLFIKSVHVMHCCSPHERQIEVSFLLTGFLDKISALAQHAIENKFDLWIRFIELVPSLMRCHDRSALQAIFVQVRCFVRLPDVLQLAQSFPGEDEAKTRLCISVVRALMSVMVGSVSMKESFKELLGYDSLKKIIENTVKPSEDLLASFLDMAVEGSIVDGLNSICNTDVLLLLVRWIPSLGSRLQRWVGSQLSGTCVSGAHNCMLCCRAGMITTILDVLKGEEEIDEAAAEYLISLLETLGSHSMTAIDLKKLICLFRPSEDGCQMPYTKRLLRGLESMATSEYAQSPREYFDLHHSNSGIVVPRISKWPGSHRGFTFHAWICLDSMAMRHSHRKQTIRRQLYSFLSPSGIGYESFFTCNGVLVVAVSLKKEYVTVALPDQPLNDMHWHHIGIIYSTTKSWWGESDVSVYIDGALKRQSKIKMASFRDGFGLCHIGCGGLQTLSREDSTASWQSTSTDAYSPVDSIEAGLGNAFPSSIPAGRQDVEWGVPGSLHGQLGPVCVFHEALQPSQMYALYAGGPNDLLLFQPGCTDIRVSSYLVLYYNPKACKGHLCIDLTPRSPGKQRRDGRFTGHKCVSDNIKDSLRSLGGVQLLFPLLEIVNLTSKKETFQDEEETLTDGRTYKREPQFIAQFLSLLRCFIHGSQGNQEMLLQSQGIAKVGVLLRKVNPEFLNVDTLNAVQALVESASCQKTNLLSEVYKYLVFDFGIWCCTKFDVRIGHIQYVSTIMKDDFDMCRSNYGVQFILNVIQKYYSSPGVATPVSPASLSPKSFILDDDEAKAVRGSLIGAIKFYVQNGIHVEELDFFLNFLAGSHDPEQIVDLLELMLALMATSSGKEKFVSLLSASERGDQLWSLTQFGDERIRIRVLKIILFLLKSDSVSTKQKRLILLDEDSAAVCQNMSPYKMSHAIASLLLDLSRVPLDGFSSHSDCLHNFSLVTSTVELSVNGDYAIRLRLCDQIRSSLWKYPKGLGDYALQPNWFEGLVSLLTPLRRNAADERDFDVVASATEKAVCGELCDTVEEILARVMWTGQMQESSWKERGQVLACIDELFKRHRLIVSPVLLKRNLFERCLGIALADVEASDQAHKIASHLLEAIEAFLFTEHSDDLSEALSPKIIKLSSQLLEKLRVWSGQNGDLVRFGLRLLLTGLCESREHICAESASQLLPVLHALPFQSENDAFYVLGSVSDALLLAATIRKDEGDGAPLGRYNYALLVPLVKVIRQKCVEKFNLESFLPNFPSHPDSSFPASFAEYKESHEWKDTMEEKVYPIMKMYETDLHLKASAKLARLWQESHVQYSTSLKAYKESMANSMTRLHIEVMDPFLRRRSAERDRYAAELAEEKTRHLMTLRLWNEQKRFLTGAKGAWCKNRRDDDCWMLDRLENFSRMRPKLKVNYNFDSHLDASRRRDLGGLPDDEKDLKLSVVVKKEARVRGQKEDRLEDEEWLALREAENAFESADERENLLLMESCEMIIHTDVIPGLFKVTQSQILFLDKRPPSERAQVVGGDFCWEVSDLREVHMRRYNLRRSALELFFVDRSNYFVNFSKQNRNQIYSKLLSLRSPNLIYAKARSPAQVLVSSGLTKKWINREISNFDYLMQLNTIAGRTYNDLSQYPVFPWILSDYKSKELNLDDPTIYRDLSKPVGVLNSEFVPSVRERYEMFEDPTGVVDKFHYGTHYSSAASVMHYLIRLEPFTTFHIELQSGKFDLADRQFYSIPGAWDTVMKNPSDVKELIPEFFYMPEFLANHNDFDLGVRQFGHMRVDDVILPPWANSPEDFIQKHRKALESEFVSSNLHNWIDLIFGYKQQGPAAVEALNVFYYCTYEGNVDLDAITDPQERRSLEGMINNFGQTPTQLLKEPHPKRKTVEEVAKYKSKLADSAATQPNVFNHLNDIQTFFVELHSDGEGLAFVAVPRFVTRSFIDTGILGDLISVSNSGVKFNHGWLPYSSRKKEVFTFNIDPLLAAQRPGANVGAPFSPDIDIGSNIFALTVDGKLLITVGHWDNTVRVYNPTRAKLVNCLRHHSDIVACVSLDRAGHHAITGSFDSTCIIWRILHSGGIASALDETPVQTLFGHDGKVTSVSVSFELDIAVSGSENGTCLVHTVRQGQFVRCLSPGKCPSAIVPLLHIGDLGSILFYAQSKESGGQSSLCYYSINGNLLALTSVGNSVNDMTLSGEYVITAEDKTLFIRSITSFKVLYDVSFYSPIQCVTVLHKNTHILLGLKDGKLIILAVPSSKIK